MGPNELVTEYAHYWIKDGIINMKYPEDLIITLDVAQKIVENRMKVTGDKTMPLLADIRGLAGIDMAARKYFASADAVVSLSAGAFVVNSLLSKLAGNIFIQVDKPLVPTKLFTETDRASAWLKQFSNAKQNI